MPTYFCLYMTYYASHLFSGLKSVVVFNPKPQRRLSPHNLYTRLCCRHWAEECHVLLLAGNILTETAMTGGLLEKTTSIRPWPSGLMPVKSLIKCSLFIVLQKTIMITAIPVKAAVTNVYSNVSKGLFIVINTCQLHRFSQRPVSASCSSIFVFMDLFGSVSAL